LRHGSLFSGIGGFDLAAEWMGWTNVFHCEWNPFGQKALHHYWPNAIQYNDITKTDFSVHRGHIDILSGGFPCQAFSTAGSRKGTDDSRYLWPEILRVIREVRPRWVVGENVYGLINWNGGLVFDTLCLDLENEGFQVIPVVLPAASVNAPHKRDRIFFVAQAKGERSREFASESIGWPSGRPHNNGEVRNASDTMRPRGEQNNRERESEFIDKNGKGANWENFPTQSPICRGDDGLPTQLDGITFSAWRNKSIMGYGNAVVPQLIFQIFKTIELYEQQRTDQMGDMDA
jgi:DNA (cytosine-5)-methyltransferase 1